jgi:hypothetical protein
LGTYHEFNERNGYGCGICKSIDNNVYRIVGSDAGVGFESRMHVDEKMVINVLCNVTDGEELVRQAIREYFAKAECR